MPFWNHQISRPTRIHSIDAAQRLVTNRDSSSCDGSSTKQAMMQLQETRQELRRDAIAGPSSLRGFTWTTAKTLPTPTCFHHCLLGPEHCAQKLHKSAWSGPISVSISTASCREERDESLLTFPSKRTENHHLADLTFLDKETRNTGQ